MQMFWKRWHLDYLNNLQQRTKWKMDVVNSIVGNLVLIKEDNAPSLTWPRGGIIKMFIGNGYIVRVAQLRTATGIYSRPMWKITVLTKQQSQVQLAPIQHEIQKFSRCGSQNGKNRNVMTCPSTLSVSLYSLMVMRQFGPNTKFGPETDSLPPWLPSLALHSQGVGHWF